MLLSNPDNVEIDKKKRRVIRWPLFPLPCFITNCALVLLCWRPCYHSSLLFFNRFILCCSTGDGQCCVGLRCTQSDSVTHVHGSTLCRALLPYRLSQCWVGLCAVRQGLLPVCFRHGGAHPSAPGSVTAPPHTQSLSRVVTLYVAHVLCVHALHFHRAQASRCLPLLQSTVPKDRAGCPQSQQCESPVSPKHSPNSACPAEGDWPRLHSWFIIVESITFCQRSWGCSCHWEPFVSRKEPPFLCYTLSHVSLGLFNISFGPLSLSSPHNNLMLWEGDSVVSFRDGDLRKIELHFLSTDTAISFTFLRVLVFFF